MDIAWAGMNGAIEPTGQRSSEEFTLPSRGEAIAALRSALERQAGPVLLTGEAGVGKTWLCRRLQNERTLSGRWTVVDIPPAIDPRTLYPLIGHALGLPMTGNVEEARLSLADALREAAVEGACWFLVIDEAQNASPALLEEVRILANRMGQPEGFSGLLLAGQTALACRLSTRPLRALAARITAHVHLRCLDVEEARALLEGLAVPHGWDDRTLERHHRDAEGNPGRLLMAARAPGVAGPRLPRDPAPSLNGVPRAADRPLLGPAIPATPEVSWETPAVGPVRPPLLVGDGMIEVGWEPGIELQADAMTEVGATTEPTSAPIPPRPELTREHHSEPVEARTEPEAEVIEPIDDHYAALQAWNEWSRNRQRGGDFAGSEVSNDASPGTGGDRQRGPAGAPGVWIEEPQQDFAPYGQLFSRLRQLNGTDGGE